MANFKIFEVGNKIKNIHTGEIREIKAIEQVNAPTETIDVYVLDDDSQWNNDHIIHWRRV